MHSAANADIVNGEVLYGYMCMMIKLWQEEGNDVDCINIH